MSDDIFSDFDALLWLRSKQGQYQGYPKGSQDDFRHQYFKASADELERLREEVGNLRMMLAAAALANGGELRIPAAVVQRINPVTAKLVLIPMEDHSDGRIIRATDGSEGPDPWIR